MSALPFVVVTLATGIASLAIRGGAGRSAVVGVAGLIAAFVATAAIGPEDPALFGGVGVAGSTYAQRVLAVGCVLALLLVLVSAAGDWIRELPGVALVMLAGFGLALVADPAPTALIAATSAGIVGAFAVAARSTERTLLVAMRELRVLALVGSAALVAMAVAGAADAAGSTAANGAGPAVSLAFLAVAGATAIRVGAIPFHLRPARLAVAVPDVVLPVALVWGPAAFVAVAAGWAAGVGDVATSVALEQSLVVLVAGTSILFGTAAALVHDDLEHVVAYSIVADFGVALLAMAAFSPAALEEGRAWLVVVIASKTAFAAWVAALRRAFGDRGVADRAGWMRRAPILGLALLLVAAGTIGWPGTTAFDARRSLAGLVEPSPVGSLLLAGSLASVLVHARLLASGIQRQSRAVAEARGSGLEWPRSRRREPGGVIDDLRAAWTANAAAIAGAGALALGAVCVLVGTGVVPVG